MDAERCRYRVLFERLELGTQVCRVRCVIVSLLACIARSVGVVMWGKVSGLSLRRLGSPEHGRVEQNPITSIHPSDHHDTQDTDIAVEGPPTLLFPKPRRPQRPLLTSSSSLPLHHRAAAALLLAPLSAKKGGRQRHRQLVAFVRKMLDRKEALVMALRDLNEQTEAAAVSKAAPSPLPSSPTSGAASALMGPGAGVSPIKAYHQGLGGSSRGVEEGKGGGGVMTEPSPVLRQQHTWVVQALQRTNAALVPAMELLRRLATNDGHGEQEGAEGPVEATVAAARAEALQLCAHHRGSKERDLAATATVGSDRGVVVAAAVLPAEGPVQATVEAAAALILTLRRCAEARKREGDEGDRMGEQQPAAVTALGVEQCVGAVVALLKRRVLLMLGAVGEEEEEGEGSSWVYEEALGLLQEIEGSVAALKQEMLL